MRKIGKDYVGFMRQQDSANTGSAFQRLHLKVVGKVYKAAMP